MKARQTRRFRRTTDSLHAFPVAPDLLDQNFAATGLNQKWGADFVWRTILRNQAEATAAIGRYIDGFYSTVRDHSALDFISPLQFERQAA